MSRTWVLGYAKLEDAQAQVANYRDDYKVLLIGPTDQCIFAREDGDGTFWKSGPAADVYIVVATKDGIAGPVGPDG